MEREGVLANYPERRLTFWPPPPQRKKLVRFPAPSHLAQRDVAKTNDAPDEKFLASGAKPNPKFHPADVPMEGLKSASAT